MDLGKVINHNITIQPTANKGFYVKVGCGRFAFSNGTDLLSALTKYLTHPEDMEQEYSKSVGSGCEASDGAENITLDRLESVPDPTTES